MSEASKEPEETGEERDQPPELVVAFLNSEVLVHHFKTLTEGVNGNQRLLQLGGDGKRSIVICAKRSGFTRHMMIGPLDANIFEYDLKDWHMTTQNYTHLPDLVIKWKPDFILVAAEDAAYFCAGAKTVYHATDFRLSDGELKAMQAAIEDLSFGDVCYFNRGGFMDEDDECAMFEELYSLSDHLAGESEE